MKQITVKRQDVDLLVHDFGGQGDIILFVHATSLCGPMWSPIAAKLTNNFRCMALDVRGHGQSQLKNSSDMSWHTIAEDILSVVQDITESSTPILGVGHSMGGTTLLLAELAKPNTFKNIWTFEPIFFSTQPMDKLPRTMQLVNGAKKRKREFESVEAALERFASKPPMNVFDPRCLKEFGSWGLKKSGSGSVELCCNPEHEALVYQNANTGITESIRSLESSATVVVGRDDKDRVPAINETVTSSPFLKLEEFERFNHFGPQVDPDFFGEQILAWAMS